MITSTMCALVPEARDAVGSDPIFALNAEAGSRAASGESILNCTMGALMTDDGHLAVMPTVVETIASVAPEKAANYGPIVGHPEFLHAVLDDMLGGTELRDHAVAAATPGGTGAVFQAVVNFLETGQKLLTTSYFWGPYTSIAKHSGRGMDTFDMFADDRTFNVDALRAGLDQHLEEQGRALVILNFPSHNPTGYSLDEDEWNQVADVLRQAGERAPVTVLMDCAYMRFSGDAIHAWDAALPKIMETTTLLFAWTASKSYCQYGARIGALIACHRDPDELTQLANAMSFTARSTWSNCNQQALYAVTELLTDPDLKARAEVERQELVDLLQKRTEVFNAAAAEAELDMPRYESGFFVAIFTPDPETTAATMRDAGVFVIPIPGAVRVAICSTPASEIPRLVDALAVGVRAAQAAV